MKMTRHASLRAVQRSLEYLVLELSLQFGKKLSTPDGKQFLYLSLKMRKKLARKLRQLYYSWKPAVQFVLTTDDDTIITCGHRAKNV